ncbi:hypothetical protein QN239_29300 [Mycolicibacterium sp. Y3]
MDVAEVPVEHIDNGMTLVVEEGGHSLQFNVEERGARHRPGSPVIYTLKSEPLDDGKPWVLEYPAGTIVTRVLRIYDDGIE